MQSLTLGSAYSREDVHGIFSPNTSFTPQRGIWGIHGLVRVPDRAADWVFFVTFGQEQGDHAFDESITEDGVLSWQSQPAQTLSDNIITQLIAHDDSVSNIYLFLRAEARSKYTYFGTLRYLTHDAVRESPVHFQWQIIHWDDVSRRISLAAFNVRQSGTVDSHPRTESQQNTLILVPVPSVPGPRTGVPTQDFKQRKTPDYALRDSMNRALGLLGEELVVEAERRQLTLAGRSDLAANVIHVAKVEGDTAGYDVRSYEVDGQTKFIEVKTTRGGPNTAFFLSPNELSFSQKNADSYLLYRLFDFREDSSTAKMFILRGNVGLQLSLVPTAFRAAVKS